MSVKLQSAAKGRALALARSAKAEAEARRRAQLRPPKPFRSAADFIASLARLARAMPYGAAADLARHCGVSTSTASKWLRGAKTPMQENLDRMAEWWSARARGREAEIMAGGNGAAARGTPPASLARLPEELSARLRAAATRRGLKPLEYAAQILDGHLRRNGE